MSQEASPSAAVIWVTAVALCPESLNGELTTASRMKASLLEGSLLMIQQRQRLTSDVKSFRF